MAPHSQTDLPDPDGGGSNQQSPASREQPPATAAPAAPGVAPAPAPDPGVDAADVGSGTTLLAEAAAVAAAPPEPVASAARAATPIAAQIVVPIAGQIAGPASAAAVPDPLPQPLLSLDRGEAQQRQQGLGLTPVLPSGEHRPDQVASWPGGPGRDAVITIDDRRYHYAGLPDDVRQLVLNLQAADRVIAQRRELRRLLLASRRSLTAQLRQGLQNRASLPPQAN